MNEIAVVAAAAFEEATKSAELRASRISALLTIKADAETEIAKILRTHLREVGESDWLAWCRTNWGWARSTAYRHLNPEQVQKHRERERDRHRLQVGDIVTPVNQPILDLALLAPDEAETIGGGRSDQQIERDIVDTLRGWWQRYPHLHAFIVEEVLALKGDVGLGSNNEPIGATTDDEQG
jgi:hypothetical protein